MDTETPRAPDCDAEDSPHLPGLLRVTAIFDDGEGDTVYFDPEKLPELMQNIDRTKDVRGRTFRTQAKTVMGWAKLREIAFRNPDTDPRGRLSLLLWAYFRCPEGKPPYVADKIQQMLDEHGMACLAIVRGRETKVTAAVVLPRFDSSVIGLLEVPTHPTKMRVFERDPIIGPVGTA